MAVALTVASVNRIANVQAGTIRVTRTGDGAQGTMNVTLINPAAIPAIDDPITLTDGATTYYDGVVRVVNLRQLKTSVFVEVGCQDDADPSGIPTAAPFGISDAPNNTTTFGFREMTLVTDGMSGSIKQTGTATIDRDGLAPGMNVLVTSANYGLSAAEMTIQRVDITFPTNKAPLYTVTFGDPIVTLARIVREIPPGTITETMIADNAISTPKLQANAVTTFSNDGATVVIDENGITIEDGYLNFPFPGGENLLLNSGFELGPYVAAPGSKTWTVTADFTGSDVRTPTNLTQGDSLTLTGSTY